MLLRCNSFARGLEAADTDEPPTLKQRLAKVSVSLLPPEYLLDRFLRNVSGMQQMWTTSTAACEWQFVACDATGHVSTLLHSFAHNLSTLSWGDLPSTVQHVELAGPYGNHRRLTGRLDVHLLPRTLGELRVHEQQFYGGLDVHCHLRCVSSL